MIGRLRGTLVEKQAPMLLVDVHGVGYEVEAPLSTFGVLPEPGAEVTLHTHLHVREDSHTLFGFSTQSERTLFRSLIKVGGVGAKLALTILSGLSPEEFVTCIHQQDNAALVRLPGVGKKMAERLIIEMRDRIRDWEGAAAALSGTEPGGPAGPATAVEEAVSALIALGYKPQEASRMVRTLPGSAGLGSEEIIRQALQGTLK